MPLAPAERAKLLGILARLGSTFDGERAAAALLADRLMRKAGLTWSDLLGEQPEPKMAPAADVPPPFTVDLALVMRNLDFLTAWETDFARGVQYQRRLSAKQIATLSKIAKELRLRGRG